MVSVEDRLRIVAVVQAELGNPSMAEILFAVARTLGVEKALLGLNRVLADPMAARRQAAN